MASVRRTVGAKHDLQAIFLFIAKDSAIYAAATAERILASAEQLRRHPKLGRVVPEFADQRIRELIVISYRVVYRVEGPRAGVLAVVHGSRKLLSRLRLADWIWE